MSLEVCSKTIDEVLKFLETDREGLSEKKAEERLEKYGLNEIEGEGSPHPIVIFLSQFKSGLVYVLIVAAVVAAVFNHWLDVGVIVAVLFVNSIMGFIQEYKAERAMEALKDMIVPTAKVFRNGELVEVSSKKLVPGDVVLLKEGDRVPADTRLFSVKDFRTSEASLTGESTPIRKKSEKISKGTDLADKENMAWMGTFVAGGKAKGVVTATGSDTAFGEIAEDISSVEKGGGHFDKKISTLSKKMAAFAFTGATLIFLISVIQEGVSYRDGLEAFEEPLFGSIAALVSGIPEGLPAILVVVLAAGATRMAKDNAVIRKLPATETLGVADHILTDKTGTVTQNKMTVREIRLLSKEPIKVTGQGWEPKGNFKVEGEAVEPKNTSRLSKLLKISLVCNESKLNKNEEGWEILGDPTEGALLTLGKKGEVEESPEKLDDMSFSSKMKMRASLVEDDSRKIYVVGAPEAVLEKSEKIEKEEGGVDLNPERKEVLLEEVEEMSDKALRTICLAYKEVNKSKEDVSSKDLKDLTVVGVVGMIDPPHEEVKPAVEKAKKAGVRTVMVTGDHKKTAAAIAEKVGIESKEGYPRALDQSELEQMTDVEFRDKVKNVNVFARLTPKMKLKIAKTLQDEEAILAMTGDGVNDAPAVKQADIGISMGIMGTDVTKEASEIVLADDNFASIVHAIKEGRIVFENTRSASSFLITTNFAEIGTIVLSLLKGFPLPLLPTQILWLNLVTDGVVGVPLALEPGSGHALEKPPRDKDESILNMEVVPYFFLMTLIMAGLAIFFFGLFFSNGNVEKARTGAFTVMAFTQLFNALNMRSLEKSVFELGFFTNKYIITGLLTGVFLQLAVIRISFFQNIFRFTSLRWYEILILFILSSFVLWLGEVYKKIRKTFLLN